MKIRLAIASVICVLSLGLRAQNLAPCGTDEYLQQIIQKDPSKLQQLKQLEENIAASQSQSGASRSSIITIPVVFHVIHNGKPLGTAMNILDAQLFSQLEVLNTCYRKQNSDTALVPSWFKSRVADMEIEFCLAQFDAAGNPTSGITRHDFTNISNQTYIDNVIKPATQWDPDKYLNIWTTELLSPLLGYATFPLLFPKNQDGVVLDYRVVGKSPANPFPGSRNLGKTAVHEVGHWLALYHTFQDSCTGATPETCATAGDHVCDTPPTKEATYGSPNLVQNSCHNDTPDEYDMVMNYMDYPDDSFIWMFTWDQKDRARAVLNNFRLPLQSSLGCTDTSNTFAYSGQVIDQQTSAGIPNAKVLFEGSLKYEVTTDFTGYFSIPNMVEGYYDIYAGHWGHRTWQDASHTLLTANSPSRTIQLKGHHYYDDFLFDFSWTKSNSAASGFWVREKPMGTFYSNAAANPGADLPDDYGVNCYVTGNGVINPISDGVTNGTVTLISPVFDVTGYTDPYIRYNRWYYNGGAAPSGDNMLVRLSDGSNMVTVETIDTSNTPTNQWTQQLFRISDFMTPGSTMRVFFVVNDVPGSNSNIVEGGLDRFEVLENPVSTEDLHNPINLSIYPNPTSGRLMVEYALQEAENISLRAFKPVGEEMLQQDIAKSKTGKVSLDFSGYAPGIYFISLRTAHSEKILKFSLLR